MLLLSNCMVVMCVYKQYYYCYQTDKKSLKFTLSIMFMILIDNNNDHIYYNDDDLYFV